MKPTSIIFLILSAILIVSGIIVCVVAGAIAKSDNIELYVDYIDDNGNAVVEYDLSGKKVSDVNIVLKRANINVIGDSEKTYVEIDNYPTKAYDYVVSDGTISMKDANLFSIFSSFRINESGFGFTGLRHYLALGKYKDMPRSVNVHLAKGSILHSINISVEEGDVTLSGVDLRAECTVTVGQGNAYLDDVTCPDILKVTCETGDISFNRCMVASTNADVTEKGNITCGIDMQYSFAVRSLSGGVYLDSVNNGSDFSGLYPTYAFERQEHKEEPDDTAEPAETGESGETAQTEETTAESTSDDKKDDTSDETTDEKDAETTAAEPETTEPEEEISISQRLFVGRVKLGDIKIEIINE